MADFDNTTRMEKAQRLHPRAQASATAVGVPPVISPSNTSGRIPRRDWRGFPVLGFGPEVAVEFVPEELP